MPPSHAAHHSVLLPNVSKPQGFFLQHCGRTSPLETWTSTRLSHYGVGGCLTQCCSGFPEQQGQEGL